jgi:hypothetical protein
VVDRAIPADSQRKVVSQVAPAGYGNRQLVPLRHCLLPSGSKQELLWRLLRPLRRMDLDGHQQTTLLFVTYLMPLVSLGISYDHNHHYPI